MSPNREEVRRLQRVLDNPDYGPALVRLSPTRQRHALDLISANKGREARVYITSEDVKRREKVRTRSQARRQTKHEQSLSLGPSWRSRLLDAATENMMRHWGSKASGSNVRKNLMAATDSELIEIASIATKHDAWLSATRKPYFCPTVKKVWNPTWYQSTPGW